MNPRIEKLAVQAGLFMDVNGRPYPVQLSAEESGDTYDKFAQLIVEDIINVLKKEWYTLNNAEPVPNETARDIGLRLGRKGQTITLMSKIKQHFGVE